MYEWKGCWKLASLRIGVYQSRITHFLFQTLTVSPHCLIVWSTLDFGFLIVSCLLLLEFREFFTYFFLKFKPLLGHITVFSLLIWYWAYFLIFHLSLYFFFNFRIFMLNIFNFYILYVDYQFCCIIQVLFSYILKLNFSGVISMSIFSYIKLMRFPIFFESLSSVL